MSERQGKTRGREADAHNVIGLARSTTTPPKVDKVIVGVPVYPALGSIWNTQILLGNF